jgi:hypothetical protein
MMQKKGRRDRVGNRAESIHDEVDVVQAPPFDWTTVRAELSSDRQSARQSASKAMGPGQPLPFWWLDAHRPRPIERRTRFMVSLRPVTWRAPHGGC